MCLIVFKDGEKAEFTDIQFRKMVNANHDGFGIMYRDGDRVMVEKAMYTEKKMYKLWKKHRDREYYAMHARFKTHGTINEANCHPYEILNKDKGDALDLYMMHNGVIHSSNYTETDKSMSDTWNYVQSVIVPIAKANPELLWENEFIQDMIVRAVGGSKLLFMRSDRDDCVLILNERLGDYIKGCWLSQLHSTGDSRYQSNVHHNTPAYGTTNYGYKPRQDVAVFISPKKEVAKETAEDIKFKEAYTNWWHDKNMQDEWTEAESCEVPAVKEAEDKKIDLIANKTARGMMFVAPTQTRLNDLAVRLQILKQLTNAEMIIELQADPFEAAYIIKFLYDKNTMPFSTICEQIENNETVKGIVDILRNISYKEPTQEVA